MVFVLFIDLSKEHEPDIFDAIRFGAVLENVCFDASTREPDYSDISVTENTRAAYPLHHIPNAIIPAVIQTHPSNIILLVSPEILLAPIPSCLFQYHHVCPNAIMRFVAFHQTCDAFGVLPPISKLTPVQVMYHFISGYTSKMAGTEIGINRPTATFSSCYGAPFLAMHPYLYADMLAQKLRDHEAHAWLINTGWVGGAADGTGHRCPLKYTRRILDAIHNGDLIDIQYETIPVFGLSIPSSINGIPTDLLSPAKSWPDSRMFDNQLNNLARLFIENFEQYADRCTPDVLSAGPKLLDC